MPPATDVQPNGEPVPGDGDDWLLELLTTGRLTPKGTVVGHYIAAKHGVIGLMRTFAVELGQHSIRVNAVCPTNVNTPLFMNEGTMKLFRPDLENPGPDDLAVAAQFMHVLPVGWVEPVDISNAVLFLASDEARYITGLPVTVDAGSMLK